MASTDNSDQLVVGDDNLYGLGVRAGFYLQWAALLLAYYSVPSEFVLSLREYYRFTR